MDSAPDDIVLRRATPSIRSYGVEDFKMANSGRRPRHATMKSTDGWRRMAPDTWLGAPEAGRFREERHALFGEVADRGAGAGDCAGVHRGGGQSGVRGGGRHGAD